MPPGNPLPELYTPGDEAIKEGGYGGPSNDAGPIGPGPGGGAGPAGFFPLTSSPYSPLNNPYRRRRFGGAGPTFGGLQLQSPGAGPVIDTTAAMSQPLMIGPGGAGGTGRFGPPPTGRLPAPPPVYPGGGQPGQTPREPGNPTDLPIEAAFGPNGQFSFPQLLQSLVLQAIRAGMFDPTGSAPMLTSLQNRLEATGQANERQGQLSAELANPDDPYLRSYAGLAGRMGAQHDVASGLSEALSGSMQKNQDFIRMLISMLAGAATRQDIKSPSPWAQAGGDIVGSILGPAIRGYIGGGSQTGVPGYGGYEPTSGGSVFGGRGGVY